MTSRLNLKRLFQNPGSRWYFSLSSIGWRRGPGRGGWKGVGSDQNNRATPPEPDHSSPCPLLAFRRRGEGGRRPHEVLKKPRNRNLFRSGKGIKPEPCSRSRPDFNAETQRTRRNTGVDGQPSATFWWPSLPQPLRLSASSAPLRLSLGSIFYGMDSVKIKIMIKSGKLTAPAP